MSVIVRETSGTYKPDSATAGNWTSVPCPGWASTTHAVPELDLSVPDMMMSCP